MCRDDVEAATTAANRLVFGERRLRACIQLGWDKIPVRTVHLDSILQGELAENEFRKDFTPSERVAIGEAIERELGGRHGKNQHTKEDMENFPSPEGATRDIAASERFPLSGLRDENLRYC